MKSHERDTKKISAMREGGHKLSKIREELAHYTAVGMHFSDIEAEAQRLIRSSEAVPNFSLVPGYHWATCIMKNDEMCHGIPSQEKIVHDGDLVTIDVGLLYQGYNLDTTTTFIVGTKTPQLEEFLAVGKKALAKAIEKAKVGNSVFDISFAMQKIVERHGYNMVYQLTGHGIDTELHADPQIPCIAQRSDKRVMLYDGQTLAIEVMYTQGDAELVVAKDGWTYSTKDHSLSGMIEETVLVTPQGPEILTSI